MIVNNVEIPASIEDNTIKFKKITYVGSRGETREWQINIKLLFDEKYVRIDKKLFTADLTNYKAEITVSSYVKKDGKENIDRIITPTYVTDGKNLGKKNATNCLTQAIKDANGIYNKHIKKVKIVSDVKQRILPMLVKKMDDTPSSTLKSEDFKNGLTLQPKLNGIRAVIYYENNTVIMYSRTGHNFSGKTQIEEEMKHIFHKFKTPYFDGEFYTHGLDLPTISGQARKKDDEKSLCYNVFDVFFPNNMEMKSRDRQKYLDKVFENEYEFIKRVPNHEVKSYSDIKRLTKKYLNEGKEGTIIRKDDGVYQPGYNGYHSSLILKVKPILDSEFKVVGFTKGIKGKDKGAIIWICEVENPVDPNDNTFTVVPKGIDHKTRYDLYNCLSQNEEKFNSHIKGKYMTIEYAEISNKTGKPLQPRAVAFRTYEEGVDVVKEILEWCFARNE